MPPATTITPKFVPRKSDPSVGNWYLYFRPKLPDGTSLIAVKGCTRREDRGDVEKEAERYRAGVKRIASEPKKESCDDWYDRFVKSRMGKVSTASTDHKQWLKWISPTIGLLPIEDVNADNVEDVRDVLDAAIDEWEAAGKVRGKGMSFATGANVWCILTCAMKHATTRKGSKVLRVKDTGSPCDGIRPPRRGRGKRRHWCRSAWLNAALASTDNDHAIKEAVAIGIGLHLRPGEQHELRVRDLDFEAGEVRVHRAYKEGSKSVGQTKTDEGIRTVTIPAWLLPLLERIAKERKANDRVSPWLAATAEDERADAFRAFLKNGRAAPEHVFSDTETHERIDFRSIRDTGITLRFLAGERAEVVQREAGHEHIATTLGYAKEVSNKGARYGDAFPTLPTELGGASTGNGGAQSVCSASCEVGVKCDADPSESFTKIVARVGFESRVNPVAADTYDDISHGSAPIKTYQDVTIRADFTRLAALARLLVTASSGDARVLAQDLAKELESLVGPSAMVIPLTGRRR